MKVVSKHVGGLVCSEHPNTVCSPRAALATDQTVEWLDIVLYRAGTSA